MELTKLFLFVALFSVTISETSAQLYPSKKPKFGKISQEEINFTSYDKDPTASAVFLMDYGKAFVADRNGMSVVFERHFRIKVLNKEGYDWGHWEIPHSAKSNVSSLKAVTYNMVGGKLVEEKLSKDAIYKEETSKYRTTTIFNMPNVKEGSIIEITYQLQSGNVYLLRAWEFQKTIPVLWSSYSTRIPDAFNYKTMMTGGLAVHSQDRKQTTTDYGVGYEKIWNMKDVPALRSEPFISSLENFKSEIRFELANVSIPGQLYQNFNENWGKIAGNIIGDEDVSRPLKKGKLIREDVLAIIDGLTTEEAKAKSIIEYVHENIKWNERETYYKTQPLRKTLDEKEGSSGDINLLTILMLREAGLKAYPVIISTRENGILNRYYPNASQFNYLVGQVIIGDRKILIDGTDPMRKWDELPFDCINGEGLLINDEREVYDWISLKNDESFYRATTINVEVSEDEMIGSVSEKRKGIFAYNKRKEIESVGINDYKESFIEDHANLGVSNFDVSNFKVSSEPIEETYEISVLDNIEYTGNMIYFNPFVILPARENPFNKDNRKYPIDFGCPISRVLMVTVEIPEGYLLEEKPEDVAVSLPENAGMFRYSVSVKGNQLTIISTLNIKKTQFVPDYNGYLKQFYGLLLTKHEEQFVIKRKS